MIDSPVYFVNYVHTVKNSKKHEEHVSSKNIATFCMVVNDEVASSVASYKYTSLSSLNKPISTNRQTVDQTEVIQEAVSPEVIKLNQSVCNNFFSSDSK